MRPPPWTAPPRCMLFRLVYVPLMMPSLVAVGTYAILLAGTNTSSVPGCCQRIPTSRCPSRSATSRRRRLAVGIADDHRLHLRAAAGRDLLRLQGLHVGGLTRARSSRDVALIYSLRSSSTGAAARLSAEKITRRTAGNGVADDGGGGRIWGSTAESTATVYCRANTVTCGSAAPRCGSLISPVV